MSAGIDLALAMIEEDWGPNTALAVAREMVVYFKRPGGQQQFSEPLQFQLESADRFADVVTWAQSHLRADLSIEALAGRAYLSPHASSYHCIQGTVRITRRRLRRRRRSDS